MKIEVKISPFNSFWSHFSTLKHNIFGNKLLEVSGNGLNELSWSENGVLGQKNEHPSTFSLENMAVTPILDPFWSPFGTPRPKNVGNQLLEVSGNSLNELSW